MGIGEFAKKEATDLVTDKVFLISILLQFTIISALLFLYQFYSSINNTNFPVTVELDSYNADLVGRLQENGVNVQVRTPEGLTTYQSGVQPARRLGSIRVAFNTSSNEVKSDVANVFSGYAISKIRDAAELVSFEQALEKEGVAYEISGTMDGDFAFLPLNYGLIVPIAIILPAFIVMGFTLQGILVERKTKAIELLLVSPISDFQIAQIKVLPYMAVSTLLSVIWLLFISSRVEVLNIWALAAVAAMFSIITVSLSTIISCTASSVKEANAISSLAGMAIPMLGILPYSIFSPFFPTVIMARVSSSHLGMELALTIAVLGFVAAAFFLAAMLAIRNMRRNFA
ncbi:MAG TPA: ABC transporter permease [Candidatus Norongarragalinales archaeon]|nr:ABC transporter permease [Candidatus Norongarragalinales archaeon]